ncbi:MAG: tetratricopeptide repeat protein [bacterium]
MFRKYFLPLLATITLIASISIVGSAQSAQLRGHVNLRQADGTVVPAAGAVVDVYRTDIATGKISTKTDKKGEFIYAALPYVGEYIIAASMPGAQSSYLRGVNVKTERDYIIELTPGDGKPLTLAEIKTAMATTPGAASGGAKESADDKAKRAELIKKNEEILTSNKKAEASNEIIGRSFKAGNEALKLKNYDEAIARFDEGLQADPEHPGAPALLTNKTMALNARAVDKYNVAIKTADEAAKNAGIEAAKKDWTAARESSSKAVKMLKAMPAPTDPAEANNAKLNLYFALLARAEASRLFVTKVDPNQADAGITAYEEYIAAEADPVKKSKAEHDMAQMLFDANAYEKAKPAYEKILTENPDDVESLKNLGLILYNLGFVKEADGKKEEAKASYQLAANYLQRYVDKAPDGQLKTDAQDILKNMKEQQNVQAEKTSTPTRRRKP